MKLPILDHTWPFPSVNGVCTPESIALAQMPTPPKPTPYQEYQLTYPSGSVEEALL